MSTDDGSASAQSSLLCLTPSFGRLGCPCALSTLPVCPALHSPREVLPSLAVTVMWLLGPCGSPGKDMNLAEDSNYFCQINKLINLPFILQI